MRRVSGHVAGLLFVLATVALASPPFDRTHDLYASVLERFVDEGLVDYAALQKSPGDLDRYLDSLARVAEAELRDWPEPDRIAFLLNLYNVQTLRLILDHYPVDSIKDIGGFFRGPWRQPVVRLFGETITLDDLEHGILRKQYREPRIHFALVCAARGCPALRREPYVGDRLDAQLDDQGRRFLSEPGKNRFDPAEGVLHLSPIFKWFR
ncbi:MAG: DUF547 domain-containing protein, partial [Candidatus Binatia bacterium]